MNYKLAKEIYGNAWYIDPLTLMQLTKTLEFHQSGNVVDKKEEKANAFSILCNTNNYNASELQRMKDIPAGSIAVYNFDSVITKHGGWSHHGTTEIAAQFAEMEKEENIIGHIFKVESGGGSANAIKYIRDVSAKANRQKPLVTYFEDINASAAYYISSDSDFIFANSNDAMVGSIGTMIELEGYKSGTEDKNGKRHMRIYASQSTNKNIEFEKAINDLDFELIKSKLLDPHAAEFINDIKTNRPNATPVQLTGAIFTAKETLGTLVDGIGTMQDAIDKVYELAGTTAIKTNGPAGQNNNSKNSIMKKEEFKTNNPEAYSEIVNEGVAKERDRVEAWAVYNEVDPAKVKAGIESGEVLTQKAMAEFSLHMAQANKLTVLENENTPPVLTSAAAPKTKEDIAAIDNKKAMDELFKEDK